MESKSIKKTFWKYVTMNVLGMIGISCYILADTFFVARGIGADGLTALNLAIPIYSFISGIGLMIGMGGATRYSISKSNTVFTQSLYFSLMASSLFLLAGLLFPEQLATLLGANRVTHEMTKTYLRVIMCFSPMFLLNNLMICFVRNDGNPGLSMLAMLLASFSNIVLDYVFIFIFNMGMFGAAFATGIAPIVSLMVLSAHKIQKKNTFKIEKVAPVLQMFYDISSLGVSALITELSSGIVMIVFNTIILRHAGNIGVAAYGIIANIALVILSIFTGISQGVQPIVSRNYGLEKYDDIQKVLKYGTMVVCVLAIIIYLISFAFTESIVSAFNKGQDIQLASIAIRGLRIYFTAFIFAGINILFSTYFGAIDRPKNAFIISILRGFIFIIPSAFILSALWGMTGVWLAMPFTEFVVLLFSTNLFAQRKLSLVTNN